MPTRRTTAHAMARKAALALLAQRKIRLLNGGKRRRPSVRPSELARAGRGARVSGVPHECPLVCAQRSAWAKSRLAAGGRTVRGERIHPVLIQRAVKMAKPPRRPLTRPRACFVAMLDPKSYGGRMMRPHLLRRKAACGVEPRLHSDSAPEPDDADGLLGTPGPRCAGDVFAPCYIAALRRRGPRGEGVEGRRRIDQRRACIDCDRNAQRFDQFFW